MMTHNGVHIVQGGWNQQKPWGCDHRHQFWEMSRMSVTIDGKSSRNQPTKETFHSLFFCGGIYDYTNLVCVYYILVFFEFFFCHSQSSKWTGLKNQLTKSNGTGVPGPVANVVSRFLSITVESAKPLLVWNKSRRKPTDLNHGLGKIAPKYHLVI